jgi:RNA polymerase sigma-70 factor (ECF subfamily)
MLSDLNNNRYDEYFLFQRVTLGDEEAFREVVYYYSPKLISFLFSITKTMHIAEEIMQEAFLRLWQNRENVETDNLGGWLYRVASNLAYSYLKREALNDRLLSSLKKKQENQFSEIDQQMDYKECNELIHKALSQLPDQQRKVYQLSLQEGMSRKEVADVLNISPNTVRNHLTRALQFLRHFLSHATILIAFFFSK